MPAWPVWLSQLPEACFEQRPWLFVYHAWALVLSGQVGDLGTAIGGAPGPGQPRCGGNFLHDQAGARALHGQVEAIQAYGFALHGDLPNMIQSAWHALELLPERAYSIRVWSPSCWEARWLFQNDTANAEKSLEQAVQMTLRAGNIHAV